MFDIRRNQKNSKGNTKEQNVPKENQAEPRKLQKFNQKGAPQKENQVKSDFFSLSFLFEIIKTIMAHLYVLRR